MRRLRRPRCPSLTPLLQRCARWPWVDWARSLARAGQSADPAPGRCLPVPPHSGLWSQGTTVRSQVPREPRRAFAPLSDPGRTSAPCLWRRSGAVPAHAHVEDSCHKYPFGTQSRGFGTHYLRFVPPLRDDYARLASGWWLAFSGWDWLPTESFRAVSACASPAPGLSLAREHFRVASAVARRRPHRPVRAAFPHTVPRVTVSPRRWSVPLVLRAGSRRQAVGSSAPTASPADRPGAPAICAIAESLPADTA